MAKEDDMGVSELTFLEVNSEVSFSESGEQGEQDDLPTMSSIPPGLQGNILHPPGRQLGSSSAAGRLQGRSAFQMGER